MYKTTLITTIKTATGKEINKGLENLPIRELENITILLLAGYKFEEVWRVKEKSPKEIGLLLEMKKWGGLNENRK